MTWGVRILALSRHVHKEQRINRGIPTHYLRSQYLRYCGVWGFTCSSTNCLALLCGSSLGLKVLGPFPLLSSSCSFLTAAVSIAGLIGSSRVGSFFVVLHWDVLPPLQVHVLGTLLHQWTSTAFSIQGTYTGQPWCTLPKRKPGTGKKPFHQ